MQTGDLSIILPEIVLSVFAMAGLIAGAYGGRDRLGPAMIWTTSALFAALAAWIGLQGAGTATAFGEMFTDDAFARFAKVTILLSAAAVLLMGKGYMARCDLIRFEYPLLIALAAVGMMVMVSASDLMALYMGLELQSLSLYVIAALRRDSVRSTEAGLKYFVLGALSSGLLLFGASLVYGFAGTTGFAGIFEAVQGRAPVGLLIGLSLVIAGLAFKISAAPFHMWTPDVYEGAPTSVTAFFATAPKIAAMALLARVVYGAFGGIVGDWQQILAALSVASMFLGAVAAIGQRNIKRLMAYSSIAHMGFALMGLAAGTVAGVEAMLIYLVIYVTMNVGAFAFILSMERDGAPVVEISALSLYSRRSPTRALAMLVLLFSLAGVPPLVGFFAKYSVLLAAVEAGLVWLAVLGVIASVIGAFYYIRIVYIMYFGDEESELDAGGSTVLASFLVVSAALMLFGLWNLAGIEGPAAAAASTLVR